MAGYYNIPTPSGYLKMLIFQPANEIQRKPIVNNNSTHAITINETTLVNVRSLIGCLFVLLLIIFLIIADGLFSQWPHYSNNYTSDDYVNK